MLASGNLLDAELALDRIEAVLARELPAHLRAFAASYVAGHPAPPAPSVLAQRSTLAAAASACAHPILAVRGLALLRLALAPVVPRASADPARPDAAFALFHAIHGAQERVVDAPVPGPVQGWREVDDVVVQPAAAWDALAARYRVTAAVRFVSSAQRARTFVVGPAECIVVVPTRLDTPAARFALMHELGHVLAACLSPPGLPRALDEGVAAFVALPADPLARAARARRLALAQHLAAVEQGLAPRPAELPWSLRHDAGAQASYVAAEAIADELARAPDLRAAVAALRDRFDTRAAARLGAGRLV